MALLRQQKLIIISLILYWPTIFILAHIPIPQVVREADVSDKGVHFLAYLILTFLLWSAINPYKKVNWRPRVFLSKTRAGAWLILLVVALYGVCDELLQNFVAGRTCDAMDLVSDLVATLTGLIALSIFNFWPALLMVTGVTIFGLTNIARVNISNLLPVTNIAFHLFAYAFLTLLWLQYIHDSTLLKAPKLKWLIAASIPPMGFLIVVKLGSLILGRSFTIKDIILSAVGIAAVVATIYLTTLSRQRLAGGPPPNNS
jgi:VanZ family protein